MSMSKIYFPVGVLFWIRKCILRVLHKKDLLMVGFFELIFWYQNNRGVLVARPFFYLM